MSVLVFYASTHGHTGKIATRLADAIRGEGLEVELHKAGAGAEPAPEDHDAVIVAGSIHAGRHQRALVHWVKRHRDALDDRTTAFVSVSLTAAEDTAEAQEATRRCIEEFIDDTGWTPARSEAVAGALQYREYDVFTRVLIRLMMKRQGHPTDTSQDYDYTDWDDVDRLGRQFAAGLAGS